MSFATPEMSGAIGQSNELTTATPIQKFSQASEIKFNSDTKNRILAHNDFASANDITTGTDTSMGASFHTASGTTNIGFEPTTSQMTTSQMANNFASQMANNFLKDLKTSQISNEVNTEHLHFGLLDHQKHIKDMHFGLKHHTEALNHLHTLQTSQNSENKIFHSGLSNHMDALNHLKSENMTFDAGLNNHMDALNHLNKKQIEFGEQLKALSAKLDDIQLQTSSKHSEVTQCFGALNDVLQTHAENITDLKKLKTSLKNNKKILA